MKIFPILIAATTLLYAQGSFAAIKCWKNSEGYRECGNVVPPEYAQKETRTVNKRAVTTDVRERAKTREEILQERRIAEEQRQRESEKKKLSDEQASKDRVLLSTFLSGEEIIAARERKVAVFDGYLELSLISIAKLKAKLEEEQRQVADLERAGQQIPKSSTAQIRATSNQIALKEAFIRQKEAEKAKLTKKYDEDYKRFMELKSKRR